jgi:hypothetical protein
MPNTRIPMAGPNLDWARLSLRPWFWPAGVGARSRVPPGHPAFSRKILLGGYLPEYLYEIGRLDTSLPFAELRRRAHINAKAQAADDATDFSLQIRAGLPGTGP